MRLQELKDISNKDLLDKFGADKSKSKIADSFVKIGLPSNKNEEYRYASVKALFDQEFVLLQKDIGDIEPSDRLIIVDGIVTAAPKEVEVSYTNKIDVDRTHFDPIYFLGHIATKLVLSIKIKSELRLEVVHKFTKSQSFIPYRIALYIEKNIHARVSESFEADGVNKSFIMYGYDTFIDRDATLTLIKNQTTKKGNYRSIASHRFEVGTNATINLHTYDFGSASALQTIQANLGNHAHIEASHLLYVSANAKRGTVTKFIHIGEHSTSNQLAKSILTDNARGIFDALIHVKHSGKHTKAHQNSKAILLRDGAHMASKPQLEIYIDELEASHGSTTGQLDEGQLFYLQSRGIKEKDARKILVIAFANELIDILEDEKMRDALHENFEQAFYDRAMRVEQK